ncbi:hypothetical protein F5X97DRAFT_321604 [Nemania serpens]|nr:hypothetical protein F5X97DRAFT_321604 [Nemania serpens]
MENDREDFESPYNDALIIGTDHRISQAGPPNRAYITDHGHEFYQGWPESTERGQMRSESEPQGTFPRSWNSRSIDGISNKVSQFGGGNHARIVGNENQISQRSGKVGDKVGDKVGNIVGNSLLVAFIVTAAAMWWLYY